MKTKNETFTLHTPRLVLDRFAIDDAEAMFTCWANDPRVTKYLRWTPHKNVEQTQKLLETWVSEYALPDTLQWAIRRKSDNALLGCIGVVDSEEDPAIKEPGYALGYAHWGQGYMTEALAAVVEYCFATLQMPQLACCHAVANPASGAVMQKCGFVYTHKAEYHKFDGTPVACLCYQLTRDEWLQKRTVLPAYTGRTPEGEL